MLANPTARFVGTLLVSAVLGGGAVVLPDGEAKKTVESACSSCHSLDVIAERRWSRERWRDAVDSMIVRGAALNKEEAARVVDYLAAHFGASGAAAGESAKDAKARRLVEDICTLCHELGRVKTQELTWDEWAGEIKGMISEGAPVTDEEFNMIVDYLAKNYGPQEERK